MEWHTAIDLITPHVFRIDTPDASGSGWLVSRSHLSDFCIVATAAHVVNSAHYWEKPIRLTHHASGQTLLLRAEDRALVIDEKTDTAAISFNCGEIPMPEQELPLLLRDHNLKPGVEIGWLGYPAIPGANLCFFEGHISAYIANESSYLVDGVAINGVSGGPAFWKYADRVELAGLVSAYIPNRNTGASLPGVALIRDVNQFHEYADRVKSLDEAQAEQTPPKEPPPSNTSNDGEVPARA